MKPFLPLLLVTLLLAACPDAKSPKAPPMVPEPKAGGGIALPVMPASR